MAMQCIHRLAPAEDTREITNRIAKPFRNLKFIIVSCVTVKCDIVKLTSVQWISEPHKQSSSGKHRQKSYRTALTVMANLEAAPIKVKSNQGWRLIRDWVEGDH
jgi:hypothetical protein